MIALLMTVAAIAAPNPEHPPVGCHTIACERRVKRRVDRHRRWLHYRAVRHRRWAHQREIKGLPVAIASWYYDAGATACGTHYPIGVANLTMRCGSHVKLCTSVCVIATVQDRGPYIAGRLFDLNPGARAALGCPDLCSVRWRALGVSDE